MTVSKLIDPFQRHINYVRISVTDRCDLRCVYCMEEKMQFIPRTQLLSLEEIYTIAQSFTELGVTKIRITGGEPLVRKGILGLLEKIRRLAGLKELVLTTNGSQLTKMAGQLKAAGVDRLNISLDSLDATCFKQVTRIGNLDNILAGIDAAIAAGFKGIKLNTVIMKNRNHEEIIPLVRFAIAKNIDISFIEEMPLGINTDHNRADVFYSNEQIKKDIQKEFMVLPSRETTGGPARYFKSPDFKIKIGFISPHSHNFCDDCNRVRVTSKGLLLLCLGQEHSVDLKSVIRENPKDFEQLKNTITTAMEIKPKGHEFDLHSQPIIFRHMNMTGG